MLVDQRRGNILKTLESQGFASLQELVDQLGASESTLRRDLEHLDRIGQIRRTRGGAAFVGESLTTFDDRRGRAVGEKQAIGRKAAELVEPGETVFLDGGTTTLEVARHLAGKSLQVVTNSLPIVNLLVGAPDIELLFVGGYLYPKTGVALGSLTVAAVRQVHARRLFMSTGGITAGGLFNSNSLLVESERQMMESADEVIVVADSSKLGHSELAQVCPLSRVHKLVTDTGITDEWRATMLANGVEVITA
ncbi:MAG: DeoR/GlpR transcriptional regulator [Planctomycetaceae bacterium]|nr:DeoR/GlpR transcriptional regulator [Planctomycetaceae bacterium]